MAPEEPALKYSELRCSPQYLGHHGLTWPPRRRAGHILPLWVTAVQDHPGGLFRGLCRDLPVHPKTCPSQKSSPHSHLSWGGAAPSITGVTARPKAPWGAEGFGVIPPKQ